MSTAITTDQVPHHLDLVIDFVNTLDPDEATDAFATPTGLVQWLAERGLLRPDAPPASDIERREATRLREALRALMLEHNGAAADAQAAGWLESIARRGDLAVHFGDRGAVTVAPRAEGVDGALASVLVPVVDAIGDGSWQRVKACRASDCEWAFYDRSRNRSGVWCEMAVCGNREKVRAYRGRRPVGPPTRNPRS